MTEELRVAARVVGIFDGLGLPCLVGGSVASSLYGYPRSTHDIDLAVRMDPADVKRLLRAVGDDFYIAEEAVREAIANFSAFNLVDYDTMLKIDVFVLDDGEVSRTELAHISHVAVGDEHGVVLPLPRAEDLVVRKLHWFVAGGRSSDRQWQDVQGVLKVQRERIDTGELRRLAELLLVGDELERALVEAGLAAGDLFR